jgi:hypothetical protein
MLFGLRGVEADLIAQPVDRMTNSVDPTETKGLVKRLGIARSLLFGAFLVKTDPEFGCLAVVLASHACKSRAVEKCVARVSFFTGTALPSPRQHRQDQR